MLLPRSLATSIDKVAQKSLGRDWNLYATLLTHWAEIVGSDYATVTTPVKISFPKGRSEGEQWTDRSRTDGVLLVKIPQGLVLDFTYKTAQILGRITSFFGYPVVSKITFAPFYGEEGPAPKPAPSPEDETLAEQQADDLTKDIENNELKERLQSLAETLILNKSVKG